MADYSKFPFDDLSLAEIASLARDSKNLRDDEFLKACMEAIRCRPTKRVPDSDPTWRKMEGGLLGDFDWSEITEEPPSTK